MPLKRTGLQTIDLPLRPAVCASAAFVGKKEGEGPLGNLFDHVAQDELYGQDTFELAEKRLYLDAIRKAIQKGGLKPENVQFLLGGDLLNQIITASFSARELGIPFIGLYGACSTMAESLCLGSMLLDGEHASTVVCAASSHFCTAERQYRYPLEFGSQRPPTAQWTVTGAGAALLSLEPPVPPQARVTRVCMGRVVDLGVNDANNMGAAMAPEDDNIGPCSERNMAQTVDKPLVLGKAAFLAPFGRSQRSRKMLRHKALGLCPKPRQGPEAPAPRTLSAAWTMFRKEHG